MTRALRPFGHPVPEAGEALFETIICAAGQATLRAFLDAYRLAVERRSDGLAPALEAWLDGPPSAARAATAWDLSFGLLGLAMKDIRADIPEAALRAGLRLAEGGQGGSWTARTKPAPVIFAGHLIERIVEARVEAGAVSLLTDVGARHDLRREGDGWACDGLDPLPTVAPWGRAMLLPRPALPTGGGSGFLHECHSVEAVTPTALATFRGGFRLLARAAPDYLRWVDRVLNGIVVGALQPSYRTVTGSWEEVPGFIHASHPHGPAEVAEFLVHECAHQYFYMLERLGPMDDGSDPRLYWSPPIRRERPLSRVLMAYHALANTLVLFDRIKAAGLDRDGHVAQSRPRLVEDVETLAGPLRGNAALTACGRALFEPLDERVAAFAA